MFTIYANNQLIYTPGDQELLVLNPKLTLEMGAAGSLEFSVPPGHPFYNSLKQLSTVVYAKLDNTELFRGRVLSNSRDFYNFRQTYCEGALSYLVDSVQKGEKYEGTAHGLFRKIITAHNNLVDQPKRFVVGNITVPDKDIKIAGKSSGGEEDPDEYSSDYWRQIYIDSVTDNWNTTLDYLNTCLIDYLGGYLMVRRVNDTNYIDWVKDYATTASQVIEFGTNLLDLTEEITADDLFTVLIPIGDDNLTIASVNAGSIEISNSDLVAQYGRIVRTEVFGNVNQASTLLENARNYLAKESLVPITFTIKAVDLSFIDSAINAIHLGDRVKIKSTPHNIDQYYTCTKIEYDFEKPENTVFTFGNPRQSLTQRYRKDKRVEEERSTYNSYSGGGALGGGLTDAAAAIADDASKKETKKQLDEFYDAWVDWDESLGRVSLGALYKKVVHDETVLENNVGINMDAPSGTINIFADHQSITQTQTELGNVKTTLKNNVGIDLDAPAGTINIFADHQSITETVSGLSTVKTTLKNNVGIDLDAPAGTINIFSDHESIEETKTELGDAKSVLKNNVGIDLDSPSGTINIYSDHSKITETQTDIGTIKTVLEQHAGLNVDSPAGTVSIFSTATLANNASDKADSAQSTASDAQTKTAQIIAWAGVDPNTGELGTRIALEADLVTVSNRLQAIEGVFSNITTDTAYASKGISAHTFYGTNYIISNTDATSTETNLATHSHNIIEDSTTGGLILTGPIPLSARRPFDITDTAIYRNAVSEVDLSVIRGTNYSFDDSIISGTVSSEADTVLSGNILFACFTAVLDPSGKTKTIRVGINADKAINSGGGSGGGDSPAVASINAVRETSDANVFWNATNQTINAEYSLYAKDADANNLYTERDYPISIPATKAFEAGELSVGISSITQTAYNASTDFTQTIYIGNTTFDVSYIYGTVNIELSNGITKTLTVKLPTSNVRSDAAGKVSVSRIQRLPFASSATNVNGTYSIAADATNYNPDSAILGVTVRIHLTPGTRYDALLNVNASNAVTAIKNTVGIDTVSGTTYNAVTDHSASITDANETMYYNGMLYGTFNITLNNGLAKTLYVGINADKVGGGSGGGGTAAIAHITATQTTADSLLVWNATNQTIAGDFTLVAKDANGNVIGTEVEYPITIDASKAFNAVSITGYRTGSEASATSSGTVIQSSGMSITSNTAYNRCYIQTTLSNGKTDTRGFTIVSNNIFNAGANTVQVTGASTSITNTHLEEDGHHYVVATITPTARTRKIDNTYITVSKDITDHKITADDVYNAGFQAGGGGAVVALITSARETADNNINWNATNKTLSAEYSLYARDSNNTILFSERDHVITMPAIKAYNAGQDYGASTLSISGVTTAITNTHSVEDGHHYIITTLTPSARTTRSDGASFVVSTPFTERKITADDVYNAGYEAGSGGAAVTSISSTRQTSDANVYWNETNKTVSADFSLYARNASDSIVYTERDYTISIPATKAYNAGWQRGAESLTVTGVTAIISNTHSIENGHHYVVMTLTPTARTTLPDGTYVTASNAFTERKITADAVYNAGYQDGGGGITPVDQTVTSITAARETTDANIAWNSTSKTLTAEYSLYAKDSSNNNLYVERNYSISMPATKAYNSGWDGGAYTISLSCTTEITATHAVSGGHHYVLVTLKPQGRTTLSNGSYYTYVASIAQHKITADDVYNDGVAAGGFTIGSVSIVRQTSDANINYNSSNKSVSANYNIYVRDTNDNIKFSTTNYSIAIPATKAYNAGQDYGANTVTVTGATTSITNTHLVESGHHYVVTTITPTARATKSDGSYATASSSLTNRKITADSVYTAGYNAGKTDGAGTKLDHINISATYNRSTHRYSIVATAYSASNTTLMSKSTTSNTDAYDWGYDAGYSYASQESVGVSNVGYETDENGSTDWNYIWVRLSNGTMKGNIRITPNGYTTGYQAGYRAASAGASSYNEGYNAGYSAGQSAGYSEGYRQGIIDVNRVTSITVTATNSHAAGIRAYHSDGGYGFRWVSIGDYWNGY